MFRVLQETECWFTLESQRGIAARAEAVRIEGRSRIHTLPILLRDQRSVGRAQQRELTFWKSARRQSWSAISGTLIHNAASHIRNR
jgi:hypothetical protein